jgi:hypothetical protein
MERREPLRQFFGGYFHQDWDLAGDTWSAVLQDYFRHQPSVDELRRVSEGLRELLQEFRTDAELNSFLGRELACEYLPDPTPARDWVENLALAIEAEVHRRLSG